MKKILELLNGKKDIIIYYDVPYEYIKKNIMDFSSTLIIITDSYYKSDKATIYCFSSEQLKTDEKLRSILFGRKNSYGTFTATQTTIDYLATNHAYSKTTFDPLFLGTIDKNILDGYEEKNRGNGAEYVLRDFFGFILATPKQDEKQLIDVISPTGKRCQVKCSTTTNRSKGKGSRTNGNALKKHR